MFRGRLFMGQTWFSRLDRLSLIGDLSRAWRYRAPEETTARPGGWAVRKWIGWGIVGLIVLVAVAQGGEEPTREPANNPAKEGAVTAKKKPSGQRKVPRLKGERLDVAEDLLDEKGLKYKEVGGGSLGVVDTSAWEVCETRPKAGKRTKATVKLVVDRPGECGKKDSVADSGGGGGGGGDDDLGGLFEGDVKASKIRSIPIGSSKSTVRSKLGKPSDDQEFASEGDSEAGLDDECWYYDDEDFNSWQLCFSNGELTGRNKY